MTTTLTASTSGLSTAETYPALPSPVAITSEQKEFASLTDTAKDALCYLRQEPLASIFIGRDKVKVAGQPDLVFATLIDREKKPREFFEGRMLKQVSLVSLLTRGFIEPVDTTAERFPSYTWQSNTFARLTEKGRRIADILLSQEALSSETLDVRLKRIYQAANATVEYANEVFAAAEKRLAKARKNNANAYLAYKAACIPVTLSGTQNVVLDLILSEEAEGRSIVLVGVEKSRPIIQALLHRLQSTGKDRETMYIPDFDCAHSETRLRPTLVIIENCLDGGYEGRSRAYGMRNMRNGGRYILTTDNNDLAGLDKYDIEDPLVLYVDAVTRLA